MAPPSLPQEIIERIIDEFSETARRNGVDRTRNKRTLASLSIVSRAWRGRSQKHLFSVIDFQNPPSMDVTEAFLAELGQVFSFTRDLEIKICWEIFSRFDLVKAAFLRCFRNLETLSLNTRDSWRFDAEQLSTYFRHFGETVTDLTLGGVANSTLLIFLTSMFPRLRALQINATPGDGGGTRGLISKEELPATGSFQGYLSLLGLSEDHNDFLLFLASTPPKFDTICIDNCEPGDGVGKLLDSSAATLEELGLRIDEGHLGANPTSLSKCTQLRELVVSHPWSDATASLLQTVRSPHLERIMIFSTFWYRGKLFGAEEVDLWTRTDGQLCEAYDQWAKHATGKIEVTFDQLPSLTHSMERYQEGLKIFLPRSIEKAILTATC